MIKDHGTTGNFEITLEGSLVYSTKTRGDDKKDTAAAVSAVMNNK